MTDNKLVLDTFNKGRKLVSKCVNVDIFVLIFEDIVDTALIVEV